MKVECHSCSFNMPKADKKRYKLLLTTFLFKVGSLERKSWDSRPPYHSGSPPLNFFKCWSQPWDTFSSYLLASKANRAGVLNSCVIGPKILRVQLGNFHSYFSLAWALWPEPGWPILYWPHLCTLRLTVEPFNLV